MLDRTSPSEALPRADAAPSMFPGQSPGDVTVILEILRRAWAGLAAACILGAIVGLVAYLVVPRIYTSSVQIVIDFRRLAVINPNEATFNFRLSDAAVQTQIEILSSNAVLGRAVDQLALVDDPEFARQPGIIRRTLSELGLVSPDALTAQEKRLEAIDSLRRAVRVEREAISYMLSIVARSTDPAKAARMADGVAAAYLADQLGSRSDIALRAHDWFRDRLKELQDRAAETLRIAADFRARNQIMTTSGRFVDEQQLEDLNLRLLGTQNRRAIAEARLRRVEALLERGAEGSSMSGALTEELRNQIIVIQTTRLNDVLRRRAETVLRQGLEHEAVKRLDNEVAELRRTIETEFARVAQSLRSEAEISRLEEETLRQLLGEVSERVTGIQRLRVELSLLEAEADSYSKLRDYFVTQYSAATQQETYPVNETRILAAAPVPVRPTFPQASKFAIGGAAAGLALMLLFVFGREVFGRNMRTKAQLEAVTQTRLFGYVFDLKSATPPASEDAKGSAVLRLAREQIVAMLLSLRRLRDRHGARAFGFTGAAAGHDSASLVRLLAMMAAAAGSRRVLIVRADGPEGSARPAGTGTAALEELGLDARSAPRLAVSDLAAQGSMAGVFVATLPGVGTARAEALSTSALADQFIAEAKEHFDLVLVDMPPLASRPQVRAIAGAMDGCIVVVAWKAVAGPELFEILQAHPEIGERLVGAVYSKVRLERLGEIEDPTLTRLAANLSVSAHHLIDDWLVAAGPAGRRIADLRKDIEHRARTTILSWRRPRNAQQGSQQGSQHGV